jgi:hypothetical protein
VRNGSGRTDVPLGACPESAALAGMGLTKSGAAAGRGASQSYVSRPDVVIRRNVRATSRVAAVSGRP